MPYRIEVGPKADAQLAVLDAAIGASVERKILWLGQNAASHRPPQTGEHARSVKWPL